MKTLFTSSVPEMSSKVQFQAVEVIDAPELARRLRVPESWIRNRTRARTPADERIPCLRLGRYVRFEWGSSRFQTWLARQSGCCRMDLQIRGNDGKLGRSGSESRAL
jgi:hypothetical protein